MLQNATLYQSSSSEWGEDCGGLRHGGRLGLQARPRGRVLLLQNWLLKPQPEQSNVRVMIIRNNIKTLLNFPRKCLPEFKVKNQTVTNCTKEPLSIDDVTRPCGLFMRELEFMKLWEEKKNIVRGNAKYYLMNIDDLSNKNESPIEIDIQQVKSREIHQYNRYIYI